MRKAALGLGVGAAMIVVLLVGRLISEDLSGVDWPVRPMKLDFKQMPQTFGDDEWRVTEVKEMDQDVFENLGADEVDIRGYRDDRNNEVTYHGSVFNTFAISVAHTPKQCYPGSGWDIIREEVVDITLSDGTIFSPTVLEVNRKGDKAMVLYWYQFGDYVVMNGSEKRVALDYYRKDKEWPSMFKGMLHMPITPQHQNREPLLNLARYIYEYTRTLQTGKAPATPANAP